MTKIVPNPGDDRSWTRDKWKKVYQNCRIMTPIVCPLADQITEEMFKDLMLYGFITILVEDYL